MGGSLPYKEHGQGNLADGGERVPLIPVQKLSKADGGHNVVDHIVDGGESVLDDDAPEAVLGVGGLGRGKGASGADGAAEEVQARHIEDVGAVTRVRQGGGRIQLDAGLRRRALGLAVAAVGHHEHVEAAREEGAHVGEPAGGRQGA